MNKRFQKKIQVFFYKYMLHIALILLAPNYIIGSFFLLSYADKRLPIHIPFFECESSDVLLFFLAVIFFLMNFLPLYCQGKKKEKKRMYRLRKIFDEEYLRLFADHEEIPDQYKLEIRKYLQFELRLKNGQLIAPYMTLGFLYSFGTCYGDDLLDFSEDYLEPISTLLHPNSGNEENDSRITVREFTIAAYQLGLDPYHDNRLGDQYTKKKPSEPSNLDLSESLRQYVLGGSCFGGCMSWLSLVLFANYRSISGCIFVVCVFLFLLMAKKFRRTKLIPYEEYCINAWRETLSDKNRTILDAQLARVRYIHPRLRSTSMFSFQSSCFVPLFSYYSNSSEVLGATVFLEPSEGKEIRVEIFLKNHRLEKLYLYRDPVSYEKQYGMRLEHIPVKQVMTHVELL